MLNRLIRFSLRHRTMIMVAAAAVLILGSFWVRQTPVDVFPDLSAPTVTVITEAPGMAPQELELLVTLPLESAVNGGPGVHNLRSVSAAGISVIWVEFEWTQDIYLARQIVAERIQGVDLPAQVQPPSLGPISSIMGEITFVALTSEGVSPMELRRVAETVVRRNLLAVSGISQVVPIGGDVRSYQIKLDPEALSHHAVSVADVVDALEKANRSPAAGFHVDQGQEYLVRGLGRAQSTEDLAATVVRLAGGVPLTVDDLGTVALAPEPQRGTAAYNTRPAVVLSVQKQPDANTLELTRRIDEVLTGLAATLPGEIVIETENFRQADFIQVAIHNVSVALRDGGILVVLILFLFLGHIRTTLIARSRFRFRWFRA